MESRPAVIGIWSNVRVLVWDSLHQGLTWSCGRGLSCDHWNFTEWGRHSDLSWDIVCRVKFLCCIGLTIELGTMPGKRWWSGQGCIYCVHRGIVHYCTRLKSHCCTRLKSQSQQVCSHINTEHQGEHISQEQRTLKHSWGWWDIQSRASQPWPRSELAKTHHIKIFKFSHVSSQNNDTSKSLFA